MDHPECQTGQSGFPKSGQHLCNRELIQQANQDSVTMKFRRSGSSSVRLLSGVLLPDRATNAWAVGASADDASTLCTLGRVVQTMGSTTDALPPEMVRTT
jgi:hypothetical protein